MFSVLSILLRLALAVAPSEARVDPQVDQIAAILAPLADLRSIGLVELGPGCPGVKGDGTGLLIERERSPSLICALQAGAAPLCSSVARLNLNRSGALQCAASEGVIPMPQAPDWVTRLAPIFLDESSSKLIEPARSGPGLVLNHSFDYFVMIRAETGWLLLRRPVGLADFADARYVVRVIDTTPLTGMRSWGILASFYSGGSESGEFDTELYVVVPEKDALRLLAQRTLGVSRWVASPEGRGPLPAARNLSARSHVAVTLKPALTPDGLLHLRLTEKSLGKMSHFCSQKEISRNQTIDSEICPLPLITQVRDDAGTWKLVGDKWTRVSTSVTRRSLPQR